MHSFFAHFGEKHKLLGNFEKILKFFDKNSLEKLNFYLFLEKLLLKIEPSEITSFFYNNVFHFGEERSLCSPLAAPMYIYIYIYIYIYVLIILRKLRKALPTFKAFFIFSLKFCYISCIWKISVNFLHLYFLIWRANREKVKMLTF